MYMAKPTIRADRHLIVAKNVHRDATYRLKEIYKKHGAFAMRTFEWDYGTITLWIEFSTADGADSARRETDNKAFQHLILEVKWFENSQNAPMPDYRWETLKHPSRAIPTVDATTKHDSSQISDVAHNSSPCSATTSTTFATPKLAAGGKTSANIAANEPFSTNTKKLVDRTKANESTDSTDTNRSIDHPKPNKSVDSSTKATLVTEGQEANSDEVSENRHACPRISAAGPSTRSATVQTEAPARIDTPYNARAAPPSTATVGETLSGIIQLRNSQYEGWSRDDLIRYCPFQPPKLTLEEYSIRERFRGSWSGHKGDLYPSRLFPPR